MGARFNNASEKILVLMHVSFRKLRCAWCFTLRIALLILFPFFLSFFFSLCSWCAWSLSVCVVCLPVPAYSTRSGMADAEQAPVDFATAPALAIPLALARANRSLAQVDVFEINEAFAAVALANMKVCGV